MSKKFLNYSETATFINVKIATLYTLVHQGRIPHIRIGRRFVLFDVDELIIWLNSKKIIPKNLKRSFQEE